MPNTYLSGGGVCPFYKKDSRHCITCREEVSGTECSTRFISTIKKREHEKNFCVTYCYQGCVFYNFLMEEYLEHEERKSKRNSC